MIWKWLLRRRLRKLKQAVEDANYEKFHSDLAKVARDEKWYSNSDEKYWPERHFSEPPTQ